MKKKVLAYITRYHDGVLQLLVFKNLSDASAGIQVPGGTIESDEREEEALYREIEEESGLIHLRFLQKVDTYVHYQGSLRHSEERHVFQVESLEEPANRWTHLVESFGDDDGQAYEYFWVPISLAQGILARDQGRSLAMLHQQQRKAS
jgi:8-oxo-dGTP pyrophosphatase MutT (NUDIX family)